MHAEDLWSILHSFLGRLVFTVEGLRLLFWKLVVALHHVLRRSSLPERKHSSSRAKLATLPIEYWSRRRQVELNGVGDSDDCARLEDVTVEDEIQEDEESVFNNLMSEASLGMKLQYRTEDQDRGKREAMNGRRISKGHKGKIKNKLFCFYKHALSKV